MRATRFPHPARLLFPGVALFAGLVAELTATLAIADGTTDLDAAWSGIADATVALGIVLAAYSVRRLYAEWDRSSAAASLEHERTAAVLEASPFGVAEVLLDRQPRIVAVNPRFAALSGTSRRRLLDSDPRLLLTPPERRRVHRYLRGLIRNEPPTPPYIFRFDERGLGATFVPVVSPEGPLRLLILLFPDRATGAGAVEADVSPCVLASDLRRQLASAAGFADLLLVDPTIAASGVHDVTALVRLLDGAGASLEALVGSLGERCARAA